MATAQLYDPSSGIGNIISQVLGTEIDKNTEGTQKTTGTSTSTGNQNGTTTNKGTSDTSTSGVQLTNGTNTSNTLNQGVTSNAGTNKSTTTSDQTNTGTSQTDQRVTGTTSTTGTSKTTGTINTNTDTTRDTHNVSQTSADIDALKEVLARQMAGITPDQLAALFSEGSKAAPQLVASQANALGSRLSGSSPLAMALNLLHGQLTGKAADINLQMLRDAMTSASKIGDLTKRVEDTGTEHTVSKQQQIQDITTQSTQDQVINQLIQGITTNVGKTTGTSTTAGSSTNVGLTSNTSNTVGTNTGSNVNLSNSHTTNDNTSTSNVNTTNTTNQVQDTVATEKVNTQQTVNTNIAKDMLSLFAAGVGIDQLFKAATGKGFVGSMTDFIKYMKSLGVDPTATTTGGVIDTTDTLNSVDGGTDANHGLGTTGTIVGDTTIDNGGAGFDTGYFDNGIDFSDDGMHFADGGMVRRPSGRTMVRRMADGGAVNLTTVNPIINDGENDQQKKEQDPADGFNIAGAIKNLLIGSSLKSLIGSTAGGNSSSKSASSNASLTPASSIETDPRLLAKSPTIDIANALSEYSQTQRMDGQDPGHYDTNRTSLKVGDVVQDGTRQYQGGDGGGLVEGAPTGYLRSVGVIGRDRFLDRYDAQGNFVAREKDTWDNKDSIVGGIISAVMGMFVPGMGIFNSATSGIDAAANGNWKGAALGALGVAAGATGNPTLGAISKGANIANAIDQGNYLGAATGALGAGKQLIGPGKADGGIVQEPGINLPDDSDADDEDDSSHNTMLSAIGLTRAPNNQYLLSMDGLKLLHAAISKSSMEPPGAGKANGGLIKGPGTGTSDSIPARGPGNTPLRVANNEYILPADTVAKIGVDFLDQLVAATHTPAAIQRAITGEQ